MQGKERNTNELPTPTSPEHAVSLEKIEKNWKHLVVPGCFVWTLFDEDRGWMDMSSLSYVGPFPESEFCTEHRVGAPENHAWWLITGIANLDQSFEELIEEKFCEEFFF